MKRTRLLIASLLTALVLAGCTSTPTTTDRPDEPSRPVRKDKPARTPDAAHVTNIEAWREARVNRLTAPDGWLSLVGLHWLAEGDYSVGSAEGSGIELAAGPAYLGDLRIRGKVVWFAAAPDSAVFIKDAADTNIDSERRTWHLLAADSSGKQTMIGSEAILVVMIERDNRLALRVKTPDAPTRKEFVGIDYFPIDADFKVEGRFVPHETEQFFEIQTVLGTVEKMQTPGVIHFDIVGVPYTIHPVLEDGTNDWFFIFADRTNGRETYGPGRFMYAAPAVDGKVTLDFNRAYNPPCAFTPYSTCPLPPQENRLDLRVTAGEKKYRERD